MANMTEPAAHRFAAPRRHRAAFTLLELLAVVFIIAILTALIMRGYVSAKGKRDEKKVEAEIKAIETAIEYYRTEYNYFPPDSFDQATGEFKPEQNGLYDNLTQHKTPGKKNFIKGLDPLTDGHGNLVSPVKEPPPPTDEDLNVPRKNLDAPTAEVLVPKLLPDNLWRYNSHKPERNPGRYDLWTVYARGGDVVTKGNWK